jgi:TIR domain
MDFEGDVFISYAHLDNIGLLEGHKGWVANLHRALEIRVAQLLGKQSRVWRDPKLQGNDIFEETLIDRLRRVATLVSVVSPRYVKSEWGRKELAEFCKAATEQGGLRVRDKARIFKVLKTPVPQDQYPPELQSVLGYEFFKLDPETGKVRELDEVFGPEAQREFWLKLDDLAHDVCVLLQMLESGDALSADAAEDVAGDSVYLAVTTSDLQDQREAIKRDLEQHGYTVLPDRPLPLAAAALEEAVRDDLARCRLSIHMVGKTYGLVPEGGVCSIAEMQNELAIERAGKGGRFSRLVWIPPGQQVEEERQQKVVDALRMDPRIHLGADLLETPLEDLRTLIDTWLKNGDTPAPKAPAEAPSSGRPKQLYLIYDQRDATAIAPWADFLFNDFEVIHPVFEGDEADIREYHEENLRTCSGVLIFFGAGNECWLRRKLREVQKSAGYGRTKVKPVVGICFIAPQTPEKERFKTHEAMLVRQWDGCSPGGLQPFVSRLKQYEAGDDAADAPV